MRFSGKRTFLAVAVIAALAGLPGVPVNASAEAQNGKVSVVSAPLLMSVGATHEWTREEMLNAKPLPLKKMPGAAVREVPAADKLSVGVPGAIPGSLPGGAELKSTDDSVPSSTATAAPLGYSYPPPFTRYENFDQYTIYPYKTVGKLFFKFGSDSYMCSAASIGNYAIWTAGHCIYDPETQAAASNVVFVPAYKNGTAPYGQWVATKTITLTDWKDYGDLRFDMGGAILKPKSGIRISQKVGALGFAWNWSPQQHWFSMGYPAASPFNGKTQQICSASYAYSDASFGSPYPSGIGCDLNGGSSGGPWIWQFGSGNYLNGHNSYGYDDGEMFSPYFGDAAYILYGALKNATP